MKEHIEIGEKRKTRKKKFSLVKTRKLSMFSTIKSFLSRTQPETETAIPLPPPMPKTPLTGRTVNMDDLHAELKIKLDKKRQELDKVMPNIAPLTESNIAPIMISHEDEVYIPCREFVDIPLFLPPIPMIEAGYSSYPFVNSGIPPPPPMPSIVKLHPLTMPCPIPAPPPPPSADWKPKHGIVGAPAPEPKYTSWNQILAELKERTKGRSFSDNLRETRTEESYSLDVCQKDLIEFSLSRSLMKELDAQCEEKTEYGYDNEKEYEAIQNKDFNYETETRYNYEPMQEEETEKGDSEKGQNDEKDYGMKISCDYIYVPISDKENT